MNSLPGPDETNWPASVALAFDFPFDLCSARPFLANRIFKRLDPVFNSQWCAANCGLNFTNHIVAPGAKSSLLARQLLSIIASSSCLMASARFCPSDYHSCAGYFLPEGGE